MVEVNDPQAEATTEAEKGLAHCGSALNLALYPCDDKGNINDPESKYLKEWKKTYLEAVHILYTPGNMIKSKYPLDLQPLLTDGKWIARESFVGNGQYNTYNSTTSHDEEWIWGMSDCDPWDSENPKGCKTYVQ